MAQGLSSNFSTGSLITNCSILNWPYIIEPYTVQVTRLIIEVCVALLGVTGNIIVCVFLTKGKDLRVASAGVLYLRSLAIADLGLLLVSFPIAVLKEQSPLNWLIGKHMCYFLYPVSEVFHGASIWSILAIAVERYRGIVYALHQTAKSTIVTIAAVWLGSFVFFVVPLLLVVEYKHDPCWIFCRFDWPTPFLHKTYNICDVFLLYVIPLGVITFTYVRIARELSASNILHKTLSLLAVRKEEEMKKVRENNRTKKLLTPLVVVFSITMLPVNVFRFVVLFWKNFTEHKLFLVFYNVSVIGVVLNSAADPLIYSIVNKKFMSRLKCRTPRGKHTRSAPWIRTSKRASIEKELAV